MAATSTPRLNPEASAGAPVITVPTVGSSVDGVLDTAFATLLHKALRPELPAPLRPGGLDFMWAGGGLALDITKTDPVILEIPYPSALVWCHVYAGDGHGEPIPVTATIELRITKFSSFGSGPTALYGSGARPALSFAAANNVNLDGWITNFDTGDLIIAYPSTYSGTAVWLALTLQLRPVLTIIGDDV